MSEIFNMAGDCTTIVNFTFVSFHRYQYDRYPENMKLMNGKQKVLFSGKQLKYNA